jgi:hypothetical protein
MLFEDKKLKFDIGRKSIHGKQGNVYKEFAREIFLEYQRLSKFITGDISPDPPSWNKDETFDEINNLINLSSTHTKFVKNPRDQEGSVAAIFFECIGNGLIKEIKPLVAGYKNRYDLYALWKKRRVVIEFKSKLEKILKDFDEEVKIFAEIDCVVCWDVSESDTQAFAYYAISLEPIPEINILSSTQENFPHATHVLRYSGIANPVYVIDLKILIEAK